MVSMASSGQCSAPSCMPSSGGLVTDWVVTGLEDSCSFLRPSCRIPPRCKITQKWPKILVLTAMDFDLDSGILC